MKDRNSKLAAAWFIAQAPTFGALAALFAFQAIPSVALCFGALAAVNLSLGVLILVE